MGLKTVCCDVVNRGVALYGNNVYMATLDNYVVAFDAKTGKVVWKKQLDAARLGHAMTLAPLAVKGKIIVGVSGGEYGGRGSLTALDAQDRARLWKTLHGSRRRASRAATPGRRAPTRPAAARPG